MGDCVYHSWINHAYHLGVEPPRWSHCLFRLLYRLGGNPPGGMYAGCVPVMIAALNRTCGLEITAVEHHPFFHQAAQVAGARNRRQRWMSWFSNFGQPGFTLEPAIYLWPRGNHAFFALGLPEGKLLELAIQLCRKE